MAHAEQSTGAMRNGEIAIRHLNFGMRLAAQLPHRFKNLGHAAAVDRMVAAQAATVGVERQLADAGDQIAVGDELAALAFLAEAEVLKLHQHRDGEAVVDRGVFDVLWRDAGFFRVSAIASDVTMKPPPPSVTTQQSMRCNGSAIIGELSTSSTVTTSGNIACGLYCAWWEAATLIQASCSLVVPNSCICRRAHMP